MNAPANIEMPLSKLREPFPEHQVSKLPKETRAQIDARKANKDLMVWKCQVCGGHHHKQAVHLDYVGHAAATDRLLDTDIEWTWEPLAVDERGLPAFDKNGGLWIRLTVAGVTRLGYGSADGKNGGDAVKEIIGDAIRNAGMRFGMALDLWHKGDLHLDDEENRNPAVETQAGGGLEGQFEEANGEPQDSAPSTPAKRQKLDGPYTSKTALWTAFKALDRDLRGCGDSDEFECLLLTEDSKALIEQCERDAPQLMDGGPDMPAEFVPLNRLIEQRRYDFDQLATAEHMTGLART